MPGAHQVKWHNLFQIHAMRAAFLILFLLGTLHCVAQDKQIIELGDNQSMGITGKGPGQDGAVNPYAAEESYALVSNLGKNEFSVRIQSGREILRNIPIEPGNSKKIDLAKNEQIYFDSDLPTKVQIEFKKKVDKQ